MTVRSVMPRLFTINVERSVAFYRDQLGGAQTFGVPATDPAGHVEVRPGDAIVALPSATRWHGKDCRSPHPAIRWN
jgi:hypothetical protein